MSDTFTKGELKLPFGQHTRKEKKSGKKISSAEIEKKSVAELRKMCEEKNIKLPKGYVKKEKLRELLGLKKKKSKTASARAPQSRPVNHDSTTPHHTLTISHELGPIPFIQSLMLDLMSMGVLTVGPIPQFDPSKVIDEETLNKICPLRCKGLGNVTDSQFTGECSICIEKIDIIKLHRELPCKHTFHPECVDKWLLENNARCPLCRKEIVE